MTTEFDEAAKAAGSDLNEWQGLAAGWLTRAEFAEKDLRTVLDALYRVLESNEARGVLTDAERAGLDRLRQRRPS